MFNMFLRHLVFLICLSGALLCAAGWVYGDLNFWCMTPFLALSLLGIHDLLQSKHAVLNNYPLTGHLRYMLEAIRPEIRQYFIEGDHEELPFSRSARSMVYRRARNINADKSFGTLDNLYDPAHEFIAHSNAPVKVDPASLRVVIGGPDCKHPYSASLLNISAMSFGSLSARAVQALGKGAKIGGFAQDTGEGGLSKYHLEAGNDIIWEIGSGYFGCRNEDGTFSRELFSAKAQNSAVRCVELKLSQGAKAGKGGILPGAKVSKEIAEVRGVPVGKDCISPAAHSAFEGPVGLMEFIKELRDLSGGKPVGFKLCVGRMVEVAAMVKAMLHTGITPDFIVIDGSEGGTGAAPEEFSDHVGMPLRDGLLVVHNLLKGAGIRDKIKLGASGKIISGFDIIRILSLGADFCNSARGMMFALGCLQSQNCGSGLCGVGIATQDPVRQRALNVDLKSKMVASYHKNTMYSLAEIMGAAGIKETSQITPDRIMRRVSDSRIIPYSVMYNILHHGELLEGRGAHPEYRELWAAARHDSFE